MAVAESAVKLGSDLRVAHGFDGYYEAADADPTAETICKVSPGRRPSLPGDRL